MYVVRSATFINQKDGEFFPVFEENHKSHVFALFERENDCIAVANRLNTLMYRHYGVEWETHPNAYGVVDDLRFEDVLEARKWGKVFGVFTRLEVDNAGRVDCNFAPSITVLTRERSTAEWIATLLESLWERRKEEEEVPEEDAGSTIVVELT